MQHWPQATAADDQSRLPFRPPKDDSYRPTPSFFVPAPPSCAHPPQVEGLDLFFTRAPLASATEVAALQAFIDSRIRPGKETSNWQFMNKQCGCIGTHACRMRHNGH